ncbi:hypothetical protein K443DRAFT_641030 [Laccaria amethystina LaAM-08-1]|uniref:Uncharacterized protein n=1 Tax=Laccaria amethystina LaAM-08-1 TaxID=1095629 RepID=A0A0C9X062_9AGAR|nr:hypothetical protein K443DRAFT_641030 [Laccaria amethystina LaAM-08-1]
MTRSILPFPHPDDMFADYSLKDGKVMDAIEWLLASIKNERRDHSHSSPPLFPFTGQLNIMTNTVVHPISFPSAPPRFLFETDTPFMTLPVL